VLIALLSLVVVAVAIENFVFFSSFGSDPRPISRQLEEALDPEAASTETEPLPPIERARITAWLDRRPGSGRSPFLTRAEAEQLGQSQALGLPHLSATLWSAARRVAWIDGSPRSEGDFVGEHQVERIEPKGVVMRRGDARVHLEMGSAGEPLLAMEGLDDAD
jgi:hypothetical protein